MSGCVRRVLFVSFAAMRSPDLMFRLLLVFALLFVQQGGLAHAIEHAASQQTLPHDKPCELCATYAQLGSAPTSAVQTPLALPPVREAFQSFEYTFHTRPAPVAVARGPPVRS